MFLDTLKGLLNKESKPVGWTIGRITLRSLLRDKRGNPDFGAIEILQYSLLPRCAGVGVEFYTSARQISQDVDAFCYQTITKKIKRLCQAGVIEATIIPINVKDSLVIQNYIYGVKILWKI